MDIASRRAARCAGLLLLPLILAALSPCADAAPGDALGPPFTVNSSIAGAQLLPAIAQSPSGSFVVSWRSGSRVYQRRYAADGTAASGELPVNDPSVSANSPAIAMAADGRYAIAWHETQSQQTSIRARRYAADGTPEGTAFTVTDPAMTFGSFDLGAPDVAMNADGDLVIAWAQRKATGDAGRDCHGGFGGPPSCLGTYLSTIRARRYDGQTATAGAIVTVDTGLLLEVQRYGLGGPLGPEADMPSVAMGADGSYAVAWSRRSALLVLEAHELYVRRYPATGSPALPRLVATTHTPATPDIAMDGSGNFAVAYRRATLSDPQAPGIYLRRYAGGSSNALGAGQRVDDGSRVLDSADRVSVAAGEGGDLAVSWSAGDAVLAQRYAAGGGALGINFMVSSSGVSQNLPDVAKGAGGDFTLAWSQSADAFTEDDVLARRYGGP